MSEFQTLARALGQHENEVQMASGLQPQPRLPTSSSGPDSDILIRQHLLLSVLKLMRVNALILAAVMLYLISVLLYQND